MKPIQNTDNSSVQSPRAKKSLGQNFLQDANIARKIVSLLHITAGDSVLEIGPGPGALTTILRASSASRIALLEKDAHWARHHAESEQRPAIDPFEPPAPSEGLFSSVQAFWAKGTERPFSVIEADALATPWEQFQKPWKCVSNLPYNIASPLMWELFSRAPGIQRAVFMIQKEVGQRIVAKPESSAYGALSVWLQSFTLPKIEFIVPPHVFLPRPKVDSAVLSFVPLQEKRGDFVPERLARVLHACFQMRRKQLGTIVKAHGGDPAKLAEQGISPTLRPEALHVKEFHMLARAGVFFTD